MSKRRNVDSLLDMRAVIDLAARAAGGLDFAAEQNFVQRDIKPVNIMYEPNSDTVNITGFGIALITESSKTKTGMVPGTPPYTSPEQPTGKKFDGHSNLFSLGVMFYQMLSVSLPFKVSCMASLKFGISNVEAAHIRFTRADVPGAIASVINKVSVKSLGQGFPGGTDFANTLPETVVLTAR